MKLALAAMLSVTMLAGCGDDESLPDTRARHPILFNGEANRLNAYDPNDGFRKQTVIRNHADDPAAGRDINGQICFARDGSRRFISGEDTNQPNPPQGWGLFQLTGDHVGALAAQQITRLVPTYQPSLSNPENYGCGFLRDGRLLTTDIGDQADGPGNGQLIIWFPPLDGPTQRYCKLDITIGTAGGIWIDSQDRVYTTSARLQPGVYRYSGPFPTGNTAATGCGRVDGTGAPLADVVNKQLLIPGSAAHIPTPNAVFGSGRGTLYVTSVLNGVIAEYDANGVFVQRILQRVTGEQLPFPSTGTPLGIGVDSSGTVYYADIGLVLFSSNPSPGDFTGKLRRIRFVDGVAQPPETVDSNLDFPDGIGVLE